MSTLDDLSPDYLRGMTPQENKRGLTTYEAADNLECLAGLRKTPLTDEFTISLQAGAKAIRWFHAHIKTIEDAYKFVNHFSGGWSTHTHADICSSDLADRLKAAIGDKP